MAFFKPATRKKVRGRIALDGPAGSGKTFTALRLAHALSPNKKIAVINTESGAVEKYLGLEPDGIPWRFDVGYLADNSPTSYTAAMLDAARSGYEVLIIDSFSHAWAGAGGALELVDQKGKNKFGGGWRDVTPMHNRMIEAILGSPCHVIATLRTKVEYVVEEYMDGNGQKKSAPRRLGMRPIQREGVEYEFDLFADLDLTNTLSVVKTRCSAMRGQVCVMPSADFFLPFVGWLNEGEEVDPSAFIATEEDLRRSVLERQRRELEAKKVEQQETAFLHAAEKEAKPKVDAKELIRQKAAERRAKEAAENGAAGNDQTPGDDAGDAEPAAADGDVVDAEVEAASPAQATTTEAAAGGEGGKGEQPPFDANAPTLDQIIARIEKYGPQAFGDKWPDAKAAALRKRSVGSLRSLSIEQADGLLEKVQAAAMGLENANKVVHARAAIKN